MPLLEGGAEFAPVEGVSANPWRRYTIALIGMTVLRLPMCCLLGGLAERPAESLSTGPVPRCVGMVRSDTAQDDAAIAEDGHDLDLRTDRLDELPQCRDAMIPLVLEA